MQEEMTAWGRSLISNNHDFIFFDINKKPIFDAFYEKTPDLFIVHREEADRKIPVLAEKYPKCKFALLELSHYEKRAYDFQNLFYISYLNDITPCYDPFVYMKAEPDTKYSSEVNCILSESNKEYLYLSNYFNIKIFGKGDWNIVNYVGDVAERDKKHIVSSCQYSVCGSGIKDFKWFVECMASHKYCFAYKNKFVADKFGIDFCFDHPKELIINIENEDKIRNDIIDNYSSHKQIAKLLDKVFNV